MREFKNVITYIWICLTLLLIVVTINASLSPEISKDMLSLSFLGVITGVLTLAALAQD